VLNKSQIKLHIRTILILSVIINIKLVQAGPPPLTHSLVKLNSAVPVPALKLQNMDEDFVDIESMQGKIIVVNFWATWCPPCRREMISLEKLYQKTKNENVIVLAVNVGEDIDTVSFFMNSLEPAPTFSVLFDTDSIATEHWKVRGLPTTYVVNSEGHIIYKAIGGREFDHPDILAKVVGLNRRSKAESERKK